MLVAQHIRMERVFLDDEIMNFLLFSRNGSRPWRAFAISICITE